MNQFSSEDSTKLLQCEKLKFREKRNAKQKMVSAGPRGAAESHRDFTYRLVLRYYPETKITAGRHVTYWKQVKINLKLKKILTLFSSPPASVRKTRNSCLGLGSYTHVLDEARY